MTNRNVQVIKKILGTARNSVPAPVVDGGEVELLLDRYGRITVAPKDAFVEVTLSLDTSAYASGDLLADTQEIPEAIFENGTAILQSVALTDFDDQGGALDILILGSNTSMGTENAAFAPSDNDADEILSVISIAAADYIDLANSQFVTKNGADVGLGVVLKASSQTDSSLYVAAVSRDTKTYTASGIKLKLGFLKN